MKTTATLLGLLLVGGWCLACTDATRVSAQAPRAVAQIDGDVITADDLEKAIAVELTGLQEQIAALKRDKLEAMIAERLVAKEATRLSISVSQLLDQEVTAKVALVTEQEITAFHEANKARITDGPQLRQQIRQYLQNQRLTEQRDRYLQTLRAKSTVVVNLPAPAPVRVAVSSAGAPAKGGENAVVTIVKFEDFQCSYCRQAQATFTQLESRYGARLRVVHRDFPIDAIHPLARRAAEASRCATEQGKFWAYHDKLYAAQLSADPNQLGALARETGLDGSVFDACLAGGKHKKAVQDDVELGRQIGVTATPAFVINGRIVVGAQPLENFTRIIDEEIAAAGTTPVR